MSCVRRLLSRLPRAACIIVACALPWQDTTNPLEIPADDLLDGSSAYSGTYETAPPGDWYGAGPAARQAAAGATLAAESAPRAEAARLAPRLALRPALSSALADKPTLALHLQRELQRVGCYESEPNGAWAVASRRAAKAFLDRVNATLPSDDPDDILLALVKATPGRVCGGPCAAGEVAADGRCLPEAILAPRKPSAAAVYAVPGVAQERSAAAAITSPAALPTAAGQGVATMVAGQPEAAGSRPAGASAASGASSPSASTIAKPSRPDHPASAAVPSLQSRVFSQSRLGF
jgi:hypothetical protein